jgi:hypothetical protein
MKSPASAQAFHAHGHAATELVKIYSQEGTNKMFITVMNVLAWIVVIGIAVFALGLIGAGIGAMIGRLLSLFRKQRS